MSTAHIKSTIAQIRAQVAAIHDGRRKLEEKIRSEARETYEAMTHIATRAMANADVARQLIWEYE